MSKHIIAAVAVVLGMAFAEAGSAQQFSVEWRQVGGSFRTQATRAGTPGAPLCVHGNNCQCPGQQNACGNYANGDTAVWWNRGCDKPAMTIQCFIEAKAAAPRASGPGCPAPGSVRSKNANQAAVVHFANSTGATLDIFWLGYNGERKLYRTLKNGEDYKQSTYVTHPWIAVDKSGRCRGGGVYWPQPGETLNEIFQ